MNTDNKQPAFVNREIIISDKNYITWLSDIKQRLQKSQIKASIQVNKAMLEFYWSIGHDLVEKQAEQVWGAGVIQQLSLDLRASFPDVKGLSTVNLYLMRRWYAFYKKAINETPELFYQAGKISPLPEIFTHIPWRHHTEIVSKCQTVDEALFYIHKAIEGNWSRNFLETQLKAGLYKAQGKALTNFSSKLPLPQRELAQNILKDPYDFNFLRMNSGYDEHELEIFYHTRLKCYVVIELKVVDFMPEFAEKLNFYVSAADELLKQTDDNPSVGLLICKSHDKTTVEWSFRGLDRPIGVATYQLQEVVNRTVAEIENVNGKITKGTGHD